MWIAGGEEIYMQLLNNCFGLYLSTIKKKYEGNHFFPEYHQNFTFVEKVYEDDEFKIEFYINKEKGND